MTTRTLLTSVLTLSLLAACTPATPPASNSDSSKASSKAGAVSSVTVRPRAKEGEMCGGIAGILCEPSLFCKYDGAYPDAAGVCVK